MRPLNSNIYSSVALFSIFTFFLSINSMGQEIYGVVSDLEGVPLHNVHLMDTVSQTAALSGREGEFALPAATSGVIKVSHIGFETAFIDLDGHTFDGALIIRLTPSVEMLRAFTITSDPVVPVISERHVNLLDYIPYRHYVIALKTRGKERLLSVEAMDTVFVEFPLGDIKAKELYEDCLGNIYALSADSSYQIIADTALHLIDVRPIALFDALIRPCVTSLEDHLVMERFELLNKKYVLEAYSKTESERHEIFTSMDMIAADVAAICVQEIIARYNYVIPAEQNLITNGTWDGDLKKLQIAGDKKLTLMIAWYLNVRGREVDLRTVAIDDHLLVFDMLNDSIHVFNSDLLPAHRTRFDSPIDKASTPLLIDKAEAEVYVLDEKGMMSSLHRIDIASGTVADVTRLDDTHNAENVKVADGWAYYLMANNGYHKLYRSRLSD